MKLHQYGRLKNLKMSKAGKDSPLGLSLALLEGVLVLELGSHIGSYYSYGIVLVM